MFASLNRFYDNTFEKDERKILNHIYQERKNKNNLSDVYAKLSVHYNTRLRARSMLGKKIVKEVKVVDVI